MPCNACAKRSFACSIPSLVIALALIDEIDQNPNLTDKEKQALKDRINQILQQGHNDIN
jgi:hypothetical protein